MKLTLTRFEFGTTYTIGKLHIDGRYIGFTLEDTYREKEGVEVAAWKLRGITAIPKGTYKVILDYSNHFKKVLPHILDVPGYTGVRIHTGNKPEDTEGCILVGLGWAGAGYITNSTACFAELQYRLALASDRKEEVTIEIQ